MVFDATLSESQRFMHWKLIIEEFGPNIQNILGVENIVADTLSIFPSALVDKYQISTSKSQRCSNKLVVINREENNDCCFLLNILNVKIEQQKVLRK